MGCWNATCNITNLPIRAGEKVVLLPVVKVKQDCEFNVCYPTDVFVPFAFPLFGEYDDYGGIENVTTSEANKEHLLKSFNYFFAESDGFTVEKYKPANKDVAFGTFVRRVLCCCSGCYIKTNSTMHKDGMVEINHMLMHYDAYQLLVGEMASRIPLEAELTLYQTLKQKIEEKVSKSKNDCLSFKKIKSEVEKNNGTSEKTDALIDMMEFEVCKELTSSLFKFGQINPCLPAWQQITKKIMHSENPNDLLDAVVNMHLFNRALSALRKGYLCDSGAGSQSCETRIHYLLARHVMRHIEHFANEYNAGTDCEEDMIPTDGFEEPIY